MESPTHMYLYGAGGHAKVVAGILTSRGVRVAGVFDDNPPNAKLRIMEVRDGVQLLGGAFPKLDAPMIITIGHNGRRAELAALIDASFGTAIHPSAIIASGVPIGGGSMILHGSVLQAGSRVGRHVLINTAASIDHDNLLGDFVHVSPNATLCGHVEVGEGTHIGAGAVVIPQVKIGRWSTIGAGAVVLRDVPDYATVVGNPARVINIQEPQATETASAM